MTDYEKLDQIKELIKDIKPYHCRWEFACDTGNYDDTYTMGVDDGERALAEEIRGILDDDLTAGASAV